jgi:hypothetical protein
MSNRMRAFVADDAFREICERFRALEARKAADVAGANYEQAHLIREARVRLSAPVAAICEALDLSRQSLNAYANVGERMEPGLFRALVEERRPNGLPVFSWSIIVQVARLESQAQRQELIENVRLRGWRTRDAQRYVSAQRSCGSARRPASRAGAATERAGGMASRREGDVELDPGHLAGDDLAARVRALIGDSAGEATPARVLAATAHAASHAITQAARDPACGLAPPQELNAARSALARCAAAVAHARDAISEGLAATAPDRDRAHRLAAEGNG